MCCWRSTAGRNESCDYGVKGGEFLIHPEAEDVEHIEEICWNLRTDDLEQQSDETISFIASLV
jgi:hypothetical protein